MILRFPLFRKVSAERMKEAEEKERDEERIVVDIRTPSENIKINNRLVVGLLK